jgi:ElaB/YqjD/DUF883 family membrane-anchored ribosome-binding protein
MADSIQEQIKETGSDVLGALRRYVQDNPLATVTGVAIIGMLLARFAFLGNHKD